MRAQFKSYQSVFYGVDSYLEQAYTKKSQLIPKIRGCSSNNRLTRNLRLATNSTSQIVDSIYGTSSVSQIKPQGNRFVQTIEESDFTLKKARIGRSIFQEPSFEKSISLRSLPLLEEQELKQDLQHYLNLSVAKCTYSNQMDDHSKASIIALIHKTNPPLRKQASLPTQLQLSQPSRNERKPFQTESSASKKTNFLVSQSTDLSKPVIPVSEFQDSKSGAQPNKFLTSLFERALRASQKKLQDKLLIGTVSNIPIALNQAHKTFSEKFNFPLNPAYSSILKRSNIQRVEQYCIQHGIPQTRMKKNSMIQKKSKIEHKFWINGIHNILQGYNEHSFDEKFIQFVIELDLNQITDAQKDIIMSDLLRLNVTSAKAQQILQQFIKLQTESRQLQSFTARPATTERGKITVVRRNSINNEREAKTSAGFRNDPTQQLREMNKTVLCPQKLELSLEKLARLREEQAPQLIAQILQKSFTVDNFDLMRLAEESDHDYENEKNLDSKIQKLEMKIMGIKRKQNMLEQQARDDPYLEKQIEQQTAQINERINKNLDILLEARERQTQTKKHLVSIKNIERNLKCLDSQVAQIATGNIQQAMQKSASLNFQPNQEQLAQNVRRRHRTNDRPYMPINNSEHRKLVKQCFNKRNEGVKNMLHTSEKIKWRGEMLNLKQKKILDRVDLDRNLLIKEKMQCIWADQVEKKFYTNRKSLTPDKKQPSLSLKQIVRRNKRNHMLRNKEQREAYQRSLTSVMQRRQDVDLQQEEIKLLDLLQVIINGGWVVDQKVFAEALQLSGVDQMQEKYNQLRVSEQVFNDVIPEEIMKLIRVVKTAKIFANQLGFSSMIYVKLNETV